MAVLLDSLLEYNRAGLGVGMVIEAAPGDLKTACTEELELQRSALPGAKIELTVQGDTRLNFDHSRMCEALGNLITNAVKHGLPSEPVAVRLEGDDDKVRLSVENAVVRHISDSGIERLVEPLRRGAEVSPRANRSHLGLGLFIARQIARAHGGARHRPFHVPTYLLHHDGSETSPHRGLRSARMRAGSCWAGAAIAGSGPRAWRERWRWPRRRVAGSKAPGCRKTSFGVSSCIHSAMRLASQAHDSRHLSTGSIELEGPMTEQRNPLTPDAEAGVEKSPAGLGSAGAAPGSGFANLEDKGGWLTFRVSRAGGSIPVRITRETMEDHFGAGPGEKGLAEAYLQHGETINAKVLELAPAGDVYSTENPLKLSTGDFE